MSYQNPAWRAMVASDKNKRIANKVTDRGKPTSVEDKTADTEANKKRKRKQIAKK